MNRLSLANVIGFIIAVAILWAFFSKEGSLARFFQRAQPQENSTESPRPAPGIEQEVPAVRPLLRGSPVAKVTPSPAVRSRYEVPADLKKLPQWDDMSRWISREWEVPGPENIFYSSAAAKALASEESLRTKLYKLIPGEGIVFLPEIESDLDKVLRAGAAGKFQFEFGKTFLNAGVRSKTEAYCRLELAENKRGNELHYEGLERGILVESANTLINKQGFSGVEIKGEAKVTGLLGQILSISCYIRDAAGVQRYQELELIHLFYNLGSKGRLVPIKKIK